MLERLPWPPIATVEKGCGGGDTGRFADALPGDCHKGPERVPGECLGRRLDLQRFRGLPALGTPGTEALPAGSVVFLCFFFLDGHCLAGSAPSSNKSPVSSAGFAAGAQPRSASSCSAARSWMCASRLESPSASSRLAVFLSAST